MPLYMTVVNQGVDIVLFTEGRLVNDSTLRTVGQEMLKVMNKAEKGKMLINFERVKFMASAMLGQLVSLQKQCKANKVDLKLCSISPEIMEVFTLTRLDKLFDIQENESRAMSAFEGGGKGWFG